MVAEFILPKIEGLIAFLFFARILSYSSVSVNRLFFYFFISVHRHYMARGIKHLVHCVYGRSPIFCYLCYTVARRVVAVSRHPIGFFYPPHFSPLSPGNCCPFSVVFY